MKRITSILLTVAVLATAIAAVPAKSASAATVLAPNACATNGDGTNQITINGRVATMTFRVPNGCPDQQVSMVSFQTHKNYLPLSSQKMYATSTGMFKPGAVRSISVVMPPTGCFYQVDGFRGAPITQLNDNIEYYSAGYLIRYALGGERDCLTPPVTTTTPAPTPPAPTPVEPAVVTTVSTPPAKTPAPAAPAAPAPSNGKLPETGPGAVAATFLGVSSLSSLAYHLVRRRMLGQEV